MGLSLLVQFSLHYSKHEADVNLTAQLRRRPSESQQANFLRENRVRDQNWPVNSENRKLIGFDHPPMMD